jgi:malonate transporter
VTQILADALTPIFAGLLLGYIAGLRGAIDNKHVQTLITYVMSFAIPASLFLPIARTPRAALREQIPIAVVVLLVYAVVYGMSYVWSRKKDKLRPSDSSVVALTMGFPNAAAVGLPLLASVFGSEAIVAVATALAIGSITVSPITLAILEAERNGGVFAWTFGSVACALPEETNRLGSSACSCSLGCRHHLPILCRAISCRDWVVGGGFGPGPNRSGGLRSEV